MAERSELREMEPRIDGELEPAPDRPHGGGRAGAAGAAVVGAGSGAIGGAASACCAPLIAPVVVAALGATGAAWVTGLTRWAPYLLGLGLILLAHSYRIVRRTRVCSAPAARWRRWVDRVTPALLAVSTLIWLASAAAYLFATLSP